MADKSPILGIAYMVASQGGKEITFNDMVNIVELLIDRTVKSITVTTPPASPNEGDAYIIPSGATGAWSSEVGQIAQYIGGAWVYYTARIGWLFYVVSESKYFKWGGSSWQVTTL